MSAAVGAKLDSRYGPDLGLRRGMEVVALTRNGGAILAETYVGLIWRAQLMYVTPGLVRELQFVAVPRGH